MLTVREKTKSGFTLVELLVVISIIALLMAIMMPSLQKARKNARAVVCQSNHRQWIVMLQANHDNNGGEFFGSGGDDQTEGGWGVLWMYDLRPYFGDNFKAWMCSEAPHKNRGKRSQCHLRPWSLGNIAEQGRNTLKKHGVDPERIKNSEGGYSPNTWISKSTDSEAPKYWGTANVRNASRVPAFCDSGCYAIWPEDYYVPPEYVGEMDGRGKPRSMKWVALPRHGKDYTYITFLDWSLRRVGLKELWTLKWHRSFDTKGRYTLAGGVRERDWPKWMQHMKDY